MWIIDERWHLGLLGRLQVLDASSYADAVSFLGLVRAKAFVAGDRARLYASVGFGGGTVRHRIPVDQLWDVRDAGYVAVSIGLGFNVLFNDTVGLAVELVPMVLMPEFAVHVDLNTGLVIHL